MNVQVAGIVWDDGCVGRREIASPQCYIVC